MRLNLARIEYVSESRLFSLAGENVAFTDVNKHLMSGPKVLFPLDLNVEGLGETKLTVSR